MLERVLMAGAGGQGVVLMGKLLAWTATKECEHVTFFPAYGAEVRGGTSSCQLILSSDEITSPLSDQFDSLMIMNQASADRFLSKVGPATTVFINKSLCDVPDRPRVVAVSASERAIALGNPRVANMVMLGAYVAATGYVSTAGVEQAIAEMLTGKAHALVTINVEAFRAGLDTA